MGANHWCRAIRLSDEEYRDTVRGDFGIWRD